ARPRRSSTLAQPLLRDQARGHTVGALALDAAAQVAGATRVRELALRLDRGERLVDGRHRQLVALAELYHERADRARDRRRAFALWEADHELRGTPLRDHSVDVRPRNALAD